MTHESGHVIIDALKTPVSDGSKVKLWHTVLVLCAVCFIAGAAFV